MKAAGGLVGGKLYVIIAPVSFSEMKLCFVFFILKRLIK